MMAKMLMTALMVMFTLSPKTIYDFSMKDIDGHTVSLSEYSGKVLLVVNVASHCGFTPQYEAIEALYKKYKDRGLVVLGFPANNFMGQEPGEDSDIKKFCTSKYNVTFPMFSKISVKGGDMAPLYQYLTSKAENGVEDSKVHWNFQKYLINRKGGVVRNFAPSTTVTDPEFLKALEAELNAK
ncbi:MAG: glutathione peroxidase [Chitinophagales bacterium]